MYQRTIEDKAGEYLAGNDGRIFFIWGPRRSGKTIILKKLAKKWGVFSYNFDYLSDREKFLPVKDKLQNLVKTNKVILIDEVQNAPEATVALKLLTDEFGVKIIATGSSELRQRTGRDFDSLAGRFTDNYCLPFSIEEIFQNQKVPADERENFEKKMARDLQIFGAYPEIYLAGSESEKIAGLENMVETYVLKDIVDIYDLKNAKLAKDILTKIALQLGSEVSVREIAGSLSANVGTVTSYLEIFIKNYILIPLPSFKTNMRKAVSENRKFYFYDLGVRNALVKDFRDLDLRPDKGGVWENFIVSELEKRRRNEGLNINMYFYREYGGKEVDLVLEDYKKNYLCVEVKTGGGGIRNIFPLAHKTRIIGGENYFREIELILDKPE